MLPKNTKWSENEIEARRRKNRTNEARLNAHQAVTVNPNKSTCPVCKKGCESIETCKTFVDSSENEKWNFVRSIGLCKQCLKRHIMKPPYGCKNAVRCNVGDCKLKHHPLMHRRVKPTVAAKTEQSIDKSMNCSHRTGSSNMIFRYIPVQLRNGEFVVNTIAFLDEGSDTTFIEVQIAEQLRLQGPTSTLCLQFTGESHRVEANSMKTSFTISGTHQNAKKYHCENVQTVRKLCLAVQSLNYQEIASQYQFLKGLPIQSYEKVTPTVLIGLNNWKCAVPTRVVMEELGPMAAKCGLGWTIFAGESPISTHNINTCNYHQTSDISLNSTTENDTELHQIVKKYFAVESLGVKPPPDSITSREERRAMNILEQTTENVGDRFQVGLLWKYDNVQIPENKNMAMKRLCCLESRLKRNDELRKAVEETMEQYIDKGYARKLTPEELTESKDRVWYLPMFPVLNPNKPGKTRIVFDAAAKEKDVSLNTFLLKGPDQMTSMLGSLLRFRQEKVAIVGDIKEMFHQVLVKPEDQHVQRFLYRKDYDQDPDTYVLQVLTFGATCSPSCSQYVKNSNAKRFESVFPRAVQSIIHNHYVDDMLESVNTPEEAIELVKQIIFIHKKGGFEIRNFRSNSPRVLKAIGEKECSETDMNMNFDDSEDSEKILGMWWSIKSDNLTYSLRFTKGNKDILNGQRKPTKREVLRILMSIFDPLGLVAHYLSFLKVLLQDIWRSETGWDDVIKDEHCEKWFTWLKALQQLEDLKIDRCYISRFENYEDLHVQLHIFVDSSSECSAAVAYLRLISSSDVQVSLVLAKTRVAPIRLISIPRLELTAAVLGARIKQTLVDSLTIKISKVVYWSDSRTVLSWIRSDTKNIKGQFVAFRIAEIQETTEITDWRYVPSKLNVADDATKWSRQLKVEPNDRWFVGPQFLYDTEEHWPQDITVNHHTSEEMKIVNVHQIIKPVISFERFSNWSRMLKAVAYAKRYIDVIVARYQQRVTPYGQLTSEELSYAEKKLYMMIQAECYPQEIQQLKQTSQDDLEPTVSRNSEIYHLSPYLDDSGILRMRGRIDAAKCIEFATKRPIILPNKHRGTKLLVMKYHDEFKHIHHETVVNEVRKKFEIPKLRQLLRRIRKECSKCIYLNAKPNPPEMAPHPYARLATYTHPFTYTGIDCLGPFTVKIGRRTEKRWICLFTCLTVRAIHLEVLHSMDHDAFILAFRNFTQRRGQPRKVFTDNGTNFVKGERILREQLENVHMKKVAEAFQSSEMEWSFNPPDAPHMGGSWEALVKSVKKALYATQPERNPSDTLFLSYVIEVENTVNSRPLTYLPLDSPEDQALTPNHFLRGTSGSDKPIGVFDDNTKLLKNNWMMSQLYTQRFWRRWVNEYLPQLTRRTKWYQPVEPLQVGDVVLIIDSNSYRNQWQRGRIDSINVGRDGQVRSARVKTANGYLDRPAVKLAKLDLANVSVLKATEPVNTLGGRMLQDVLDGKEINVKDDAVCSSHRK